MEFRWHNKKTNMSNKFKMKIIKLGAKIVNFIIIPKRILKWTIIASDLGLEKK